MIIYIVRVVTAVITLVALLSSLSITAQADDNEYLQLVGDTTTGWNITNIYPGQSGNKTFTLRNASNVLATLSMWVTETASQGSLHDYLLFSISLNQSETPLYQGKIYELPGQGNPLKISELSAGEEVSVHWQWELPAETGNEVQNNSFSFTMSYRLEQSYGRERLPLPPSSPAGEIEMPLSLGTTYVGDDITGGVFPSSINVTSEDKPCLKLTIAEGTVALTENLEPVTQINILILNEPPPPLEGAHIIGLAYDFQPSGATFEPPLILECCYNPEDIPEGIAEEDLVLAYYDEEAGEWVILECTVHPEENIITALISHFTTFARLGYMVAPESAAFSLGPLDISPTEVDIGESVKICVSMANVGGIAGSYKVKLKINDIMEAIQDVRVAAGRSEEVTFTVSRDVANSYYVDVNGLTGSFMVKPAAILPTPTEEAPLVSAAVPVVPAKGVNWSLLGGIIGGVVVVWLLYFFLTRRRAQPQQRQ